MGQCRRNVNAAALVVALVQALHFALAAEYSVGDISGWDFAPTSSFYSDWAAGIKFVPDDKIVFKYLPSTHNVQEVTEADYSSCNSLDPIAIYETGNDVITLSKAGNHYYICGFLGHCDGGGMRVNITINVQSPPSASPRLPDPVKPPIAMTSPPPAVIIPIPLLASPMVSIIPPPGSGGDGGSENPASVPAPAPTPALARGHSAGDAPITMASTRLLVVVCLGLALRYSAFS